MKKLIPIIAATILLCFYAKAQSHHQDELWISFKSHFKTVALPLELNSETNTDEEGKRITANYANYIPGLRTAKFSRSAGNDFFYEAKFETNANYTALIYKTREPYYTNRIPGSYVLITYDRHGKTIDKLEVAGQEYLDDKDKACTINKDLSIVVKQYKLVFEKDVNVSGYDDNSVKERQLVSTKNYRITNTGKIAEYGVSQPALSKK